MRLVLSFLLAVVACSDSSAQVDRDLVGTWELMVPNSAGVARWVWDVRADGSYAFHAEGPGEVPTHSGVFQANRGKYSLRSTSMVWVDSGTYRLTQPNTLQATGVLGTASWSRVQPGDSRPEAILALLATRPLVAGMLEAPFGNPRTENAGFDAQAQNDGVIGVVRTVVQSPIGPGTISVRIYRDLATAQASYTADAMQDSSRFRIERGQYVESKIYTRVKSEGRCVSRVQLDVPTATVSCYLLVSDPRKEAVIITSEFGEARTGTNAVASDHAFEQASGLLTAGMRYWDLSSIPLLLKGVPE